MENQVPDREWECLDDRRRYDAEKEISRLPGPDKTDANVLASPIFLL